MQTFCISLKSQTEFNDTFMSINNNDYFNINADSILKTNKLKYLYIYGQSFISIPSSIRKSKSLMELSFIDCKFENANVSIRQFKNLLSLNLYGSFHGVLPYGISNLKNLTKISIGFNKLKEIPQNIKFKRLKYLNELNLDDNGIVSLNFDNFEHCPLKILSLRCNKIKCLSSSDTLLFLENLDLSSNFINKLNVRIPNLKSLTITNNKLKSLKEEFECFGRLKYLDIQQNEISDFSDFANGLSKFPNTLEHLDIGGNNLKEEDISKIKTLYPKLSITFKVINSHSTHCISK